ncbi:hypothetical protein BASA81_011149 [Batrachochytrium salamandrivorans]|nr:hypothetical protein BASA81_011149 [Batrachochytrium salamandrivorans]
MNDVEDIAREEVDIIIVGCGVVGACLARELSKFQGLSVLVLEKDHDVSTGSSKANSGIVHGGYDTVHGSLKSQLELEGNRLYPELCKQLSVPFLPVGSLVLSFTEKDDLELDRLMKNGQRNGVSGLELWPREKVLLEEPHVSVGVRSALYCPGAGITSPYLFTIANCENAFANGVKFQFNAQVMKIAMQPNTKYRVTLQSGRVLESKFVVNCAGLFSDQLTSPPQLGFKIKPRKGQYLVLAKSQGTLVNRVLFQAPTVRYGKGVLVTRTVHGNLLVGPSASDMDSKEDRDTDIGELAYVAWAARKSVPHLDTRLAIRSFAGIRAKSSTGDFILREEAKGYVTCGGIDSPGLTCAPALAKRVVAMLQTSQWKIKSQTITQRIDYDVAALANRNLLQFNRPNSSLSELKIVCKCEHVTEGTICESIQRMMAMGMETLSTDGIKLRTRAGMGDCQGLRCRGLVEELIEQQGGQVDYPLHSNNRVGKRDMGRL